MYREGYHERYPEALFTWRELEVFTDYKYVTWPAYYAFPACNIFDPTASKCTQGDAPLNNQGCMMPVNLLIFNNQ